VLLALAGDTMLGRGVAEALSTSPPGSLVAGEVVAFAARADLFFLNLESCISERGDPWPSPGKPFFFRAPPQAIDLLTHLGVDCVTLANNHALDFGVDALRDTLGFLDSAGIAHVGAGMDQAEARRPAALDAAGSRVEVLGIADHPSDFAAGVDRPGIAFADLRRGVSDWVLESVRTSTADVVVVTPHWGPNMAPDPVPHVRHAARQLVDAGAALVAGHSAHVFHGVPGRVLYDLGDFLDDYAVDPVLRNDLGLLWLVDLDREGVHRIEALPLRLDFCHTRPASGEDAAWIRRRLREACAAMETEVAEEDGLLVISPPEGPPPGGRAGRSAGRNALG
jgi:poly-gamma-glutamate capsule biosynthesis protein CapA/YwtB (metallophosphatase superfamily)